MDTSSTTADIVNSVAQDMGSTSVEQPQVSDVQGATTPGQAADTTTNESTTSNQPGENVDSKTLELTNWAKSAGLNINPSDPEQVKLAEYARSQRAYVTTKEQELQSAQKRILDSVSFKPPVQEPAPQPQQRSNSQVSQGDPRMEALEFQTRVATFFSFNGDAREYAHQIGDILEQKPYLSNDLETAYKLAKYDSIQKESTALADKARVETRQGIAQASSTGMPSQHASIPAGMTSGNTMRYSEFDKIDTTNPVGRTRYEELKGKIDRGELKLID